MKTQKKAQNIVAMQGNFVKEMSFSRQDVKTAANTQPKIAIDVNIDTESMPDNIYHINLSVTVDAKIEEQELFTLKLLHTGIFKIELDDQDLKDRALNIRCPEVLFPYTSRQIADMTVDGGLPPMMIGNIDFATMHEKKLTTEIKQAS